MKLLPFVLVVLFGFCLPIGAQESPKLESFDVTEVLLWSSVGADLVTTELALSRGGVEKNPIVRNRAVRLTYMIGSAAVLDYFYRRRPDSKELKIAMWVVSGVHFSAAGLNLQWSLSF